MIIHRIAKIMSKMMEDGGRRKEKEKRGKEKDKRQRGREAERVVGRKKVGEKRSEERRGEERRGEYKRWNERDRMWAINGFHNTTSMERQRSEPNTSPDGRPGRRTRSVMQPHSTY